MSLHQRVDDESVSPAQTMAPLTASRPLADRSILGFAWFSIAAAVVTMMLLGNTHHAVRLPTYFLNGNTLTVDRHSLDLSRPIFLRDNMAVCLSAASLASYSVGDSDGCVLTQSRLPASTVAIVSDGMKEPSLEMQVGTGPSAISGWVDFTNLTN
jgi:hypothetical protein